VHLRPFWWDSRRAQWVEVGKTYSSEEMTRTGWVYEAPIPTPSAVAALVQAARAVAKAFPLGCETTTQDDALECLDAALEPFPQQETNDGK
jgi:hypothetical protein